MPLAGNGNMYLYGFFALSFLLLQPGYILAGHP